MLVLVGNMGILRLQWLAQSLPDQRLQVVRESRDLSLHAANVRIDPLFDVDVGNLFLWDGVLCEIKLVHLTLKQSI